MAHLCLVLEDLICKRQLDSHDTLPVSYRKRILVPENPTKRFLIDKKPIRSYSSVSLQRAR